VDDMGGMILFGFGQISVFSSAPFVTIGEMQAFPLTNPFPVLILQTPIVSKRKHQPRTF